MSATLLIELLTEELPPKSLAKLGLAFREQMQKSLAEAGYIEATNPGLWYATPRRLALQFEACLAQQADRVVEKKGPAVASGLGPDGKPSKALDGFMRSAGVTFEQLNKINDGKAEYFVARSLKAGEPLDLQLSAMIESALKKLPVAKLMRWGAGEAQFVRPVHGLVLLHGDQQIEGKVLGIKSGRRTRGHRFMSKGELSIPAADQYRVVLEMQGRVIPDFEKRRELIRNKLNDAAGALTWLQDEALLDEVTALVEFPVVYEANFDPSFLAVPPECLILTMKANQKYFPLMDGNGGDAKLTNRFLIVSNMQVADPTNIIIGNARVVRPRLADAKFFFETDKKTTLAAQTKKLHSIVYHNKLGNLGERETRLIQLSGLIAQRLGADVTACQRAASLAKADLVTNMVGEFPELQGIMGRYYALHDGESAIVADAIAGHYHPRFNGDLLPLGQVAATVALTDKLDALVGFFGIGQVPTGDKDPFGLRRAALGVLRLLMETPLVLDLSDLLDDAAKGFSPVTLNQEWKGPLLDFLRERLRNLLREQGHEQKLIDAVLALQPTRIDQVPARLAAVKAFAALPEAEALAAANKRIVNILKKASGQPGEFNTALLKEAAENDLASAIAVAAPGIESQFEAQDYAGALKALAGLRAAVDAFFDTVMVMDDDLAIRANRLALLSKLSGLMNRVADISRL